MKTMIYKGYAAEVDFSEDDDVLIGRVLGARDVIAFEGGNIAELRQAFHDSIDDYLAVCAENGIEPEPPASGKILLRVPPAVHSAALAAAKERGLSLNQWACERLAATT